MNQDKTARALFKFEGGGEPLPPDRVRLGSTEIFSSGGNVAWNEFARDIGPGNTSLSTFEDIFQQVQNNGGNTMRLWLHTNGESTPAWDGSTVTGPGEGTIEDLRNILDLAEKYDVGLQLCLWSFDLLQQGQVEDNLSRNRQFLTTPDLIQSYIDNALKPMVEQLGGHPAIVGWEIFNEPEGMTEQYGWTNARVTMSDVQRFVNMTVGAIHRTDPDALVTNGSWSFKVLYDGEPMPAAKADDEAERLTEAELTAAKRALSQRYRSEFTTAEARQYVQQLRSYEQADKNYYTDERLIDAGGDPKGTLDYYNVHYYEWAGTELSPFHHDKSHWTLGDKPLVVGEFFMGTGDDDEKNDAIYDVSYEDLYTTLYDRGYAGALGWQWFDYDRDRGELAENWPRMLENMQTMQSEHPGEVNVSL
jgi:hypothetical protein